jgi:prepilin-type N-terminal cleavage/methylation domain-containing protein
MKKNIRSRKGVSMAEVVVALLVISIISAATMSVVMQSVNQEAKSVQVFEVRNSAENAMECFRFASVQQDGFDPDIFVNCMNKTATDAQFVEQDGSYILDAGSYTVTITLLTVQETEQETVYGFSYLAVNDDGEEIFSYTFQNGGVQG